jgi:hypothetical protein
MTLVLEGLQALFPNVLVEIIYEFWATDKVLVGDTDLFLWDPFLLLSNGSEHPERIPSRNLDSIDEMFLYDGLCWTFVLDLDDKTVRVRNSIPLKQMKWTTLVTSKFDLTQRVSNVFALSRLSSSFLDNINNCAYFLFEVGGMVDVTYLVCFNLVSYSWSWEFLGNSISEQFLHLAHVSIKNKKLSVLCFSTDGFLIYVTQDQDKKQTERRMIEIGISGKSSSDIFLQEVKIITKNLSPAWIWVLVVDPESHLSILAKIPFPCKLSDVRASMYFYYEGAHLFENLESNLS